MGIGTETPLSKLNVYTATTGGTVRISSNTDAVYGELIFSSNNATYEAYGASISSVGTGGIDGGQLIFKTGSGGVRAEKMRLDGSGNLGIGVTSPTKPLDVVISGTGDQSIIGFRTTGGGGQGMLLGVNTTNSVTTIKNNAGAGYGMAFYSGAGSAEAMRIDSSGNVGIGTTSPSNLLHVYRASAGNTYAIVENTTSGNAGINIKNADGDWTLIANAALRFTNSGGERMRIDSSGNLLVGTTSNPAGVKLVIGGTSGTARIEPVTDNVGYIGEGSYRWQAVYAVNGTIQTSDGREKNTIADSNLGLSFVQSLRPVSYKWNVGENVVTYDEEGKEVVTPRAGVRTHYGFIAQEVQAAIPEGVDFGGFVQEPNEGMMSLRYHEFIGPLVKAIKEQQSLIQSLTDRLTALEAK